MECVWCFQSAWSYSEFVFSESYLQSKDGEKPSLQSYAESQARRRLRRPRRGWRRHGLYPFILTLTLTYHISFHFPYSLSPRAFLLFPPIADLSSRCVTPKHFWWTVSHVIINVLVLDFTLLDCVWHAIYGILELIFIANTWQSQNYINLWVAGWCASISISKLC